MSLFPYVEIRTTDSAVTRVPPEFLRRYVYKSSINGVSSVEFQVIDPTYQDIENILLFADQDQNKIATRFGYLDRDGNVTGKSWIKSNMVHFTPHLTKAGTEVTCLCYVDVVKAIAEQRTHTFVGKISDVVQQIANYLGIDYEIEETNDEINRQHPDQRGGEKVWSNRNMKLADFIRQELQPIARSLHGQSEYDFWITGGENGLDALAPPPVLHFHTKEFKACSRRKHETPVVNYLVGSNDVVIDFKPEYNSSLLGNLGAGGMIHRIYDPRKKQFVAIPSNLLAYPDSLNFGGGDKTTALPPDSTDPDNTSRSQLVVIATESTYEEAVARARSNFEALKSTVFQASITLVGVPQLVHLEANDILEVRVLVPDPNSSDSTRKHWSSGQYRCIEVVHHIEGGSYTIDAQLYRDTASVGPQVATKTEAVPE